MLQTYLVYWGTLLLCWFAGVFVEKSNSKKAVYFIIIVLVFVAGFRSEHVGIDTMAYYSKFELIQDNQLKYAYGLEESFKRICWVFLKAVPNTNLLVIALSTIIYSCIIHRLWDFRFVSSFPWMVVFFYMAFFHTSLNLMRQFCAIAIVFYSTNFLDKKQIIKYIIGVVLAMMFHSTAFVGFILLFLELVHWKELGSKLKFLYILMLSCIPVLLVYASRIVQQYSDYYRNASFDIGIMLPVKFVFLSFTILFTLIRQRNLFFTWKYDDLSKPEQYSIIMTVICYFMGLILATLGYAFKFADRISYYFYIFEAIYLGMFFKAKRNINKLIFGLCALILLGYAFTYAMDNNSQGTVPYEFINKQVW